MDNVKDTQKTQQLSRFIEGPQIKTNPFGGNRAGERAYRRAERISAALHMLTNHIAADEPVRHALRRGAVDLIECSLALRDEMRTSASSHVHGFAERVRSLISHVRILAVSGFVSDQNAQVMIDALDELGSYVNASQRTPLSESIVLSRDDLMDIGSARPARATKDIQDKQAIKDTAAISDTHGVSDSVSVSNGQMSLRRRNILEVLRSGGALGIREIAANLPEYSEKMIQRELLVLVGEGAVAKAGLKRWSRYALAR
jgi:hypothetical protein